MPMYDYGCDECGYTKEIVLTCPKCEKETMRRLVSLSSFKLKGEGWYKDGYGLYPKKN